MKSLVFYILCMVSIHHHVYGRVFSKFLPDQPLYERNVNGALYTSTEVQNDTSMEGLGIENDLKYRKEQNILELESELLTKESSPKDEQENSTVVSGESSQLQGNSTDGVLITSSLPKEEPSLTEISGSESNGSNETQHTSSISSSSSTTELATLTAKKLENSTTSGSVQAVNVSSTEGEEPEGVARGKPSTSESFNNTTSPVPETLYQKTLALINDTYVLSILIPVAAGVVFACTIMVTIATCRCLNRRCRRRRLRRKALPDSVKNMRPSDRARLLAETSDEEF